MTERILIDCDPGHDDALALLLAAGSPGVELLGITTVAGNQTLDKTTRNALAVATVGKFAPLPIVAGHDRPLVRPLHTAPEVHGASGLDGPAPVTPDRDVTPGHAVDFIIETVRASPGDVTLVAIGPLTNIASALRRDPSLATSAKACVIMGGAYGQGNVTQTAEFNIFVDPEAAAIVFGAPWSVTMVGLDLTHQAGCGPEVTRRIADVGSPLSTFVGEMLAFYGGSYVRRTGLLRPPVHDVCAVAYVISPEIFETRPAEIDVELSGTWTSGTTIVRFSDPAHREASEPDSARATDARHVVPVRIEPEAMFDHLVDAIIRLS